MIDWLYKLFCKIGWHSFKNFDLHNMVSDLFLQISDDKQNVKIMGIVKELIPQNIDIRC